MQTKANTRELRGQELFLAGAVEFVYECVFTVHGGQDYLVTLTENPACNCPDHMVRQVECKHIKAAQLYQESAYQVHTVREMVVA